jgi:hypothetical protein
MLSERTQDKREQVHFLCIDDLVPKIMSDLNLMSLCHSHSNMDNIGSDSDIIANLIIY